MSVGGLPERDLALAGAVELPAPVALGDLRSLVLGDHALHLHQQRRLRVLAVRRPLEEPHTDPEPRKLLDDQHLVGIDARKPVGGETEDRVEHAGLGRVPQTVQRRAIQPRAGVPVVDELFDHLEPVDLGGGPERLELRADRATLLLALGRHARVEREPHCPTTRSR